MKKSELVLRLIARNGNINQRVAKSIVDTVLKSVVQGLVMGQRIEIRGFGSIVVKRRATHIHRHPVTGKSILIGEKQFLHFRAGKDLFNRLNAGQIKGKGE